MGWRAMGGQGRESGQSNSWVLGSRVAHILKAVLGVVQTFITNRPRN
jgi:hypothetical protein